MNIVLLSIVIILAITSLSVKKSINSLISFALMMLVLGLYYISLNEKLLGLFQIFVYSGGISVLMLFGITLIGTTFKPTKSNPWTAAVAFGFFLMITILFFKNHTLLTEHHNEIVESQELFATSFSDMVILFALIASSLLYGTIKMIHILKPKRSDDV